MEKRIKYICFYNFKRGLEQRENVQSATTFVTYIISKLRMHGYGVDIVSKSPLTCNEFRLSFGGQQNLEGDINIRHFFSLGCRNTKIVYLLGRTLNTIHFFLWCLFNIKHDEQIIVYHSYSYCVVLYWLKLIKRPIIIGEFGELYQDVINLSPVLRKYEYKFVNCCDKYIFVTELLDKKLNSGKHRKPSVIIYGIYKREEIVSEKFDDGKIHVVYGGTLEPNKGSKEAVMAAKYLPASYIIHICGFGSEKNVNLLKSLIEEINRVSGNKVVFEGELKGDSYNRFIQRCQIGLCTQNPDANFTNTSFPSKILVYLSNGLSVVSINIPAVYYSAIAPAVTFYDKQSPESIATAILQCSQEKSVSSSELLSTLDNKFSIEIDRLLEK